MGKRLPVLQTPVSNRLCWECDYLHYSPSTPNYSDLTPGSNMDLYCVKSYWEFDQGRELGHLRACLTTAERCAAFKTREE